MYVACQRSSPTYNTNAIQWIPAVLTPLFGLDDSEKEKASIFVEDLCFIQTMHWVRDTEVLVL
jgi:hypothetical protein